MIRIVERLLFAIAAVSLGWYASVRIAAAHEQTALSRELQVAQARLVGFRDGAQIQTPRSRGAAKERPVRTTSSTSTRSTTTVGDLVGKIELPRLRLAVGAREGIDMRTLRVAAGHVPGTALPGEAGNAAFAAHRDTFFRPLKDVREGDEITVATPTGNYRYVVSKIDIVEPNDVSVLDATSEPVLTLITCYPFNYIGSAPQRFIVRARLKTEGAN